MTAAAGASTRRKAIIVTLIAIGLCLLHAWMAVSVSRNFSSTFDEIAHITSGHIYWAEGDFRFQPENGNFPQRWAGLPLFLSGVDPAPIRADGDVWAAGETFFYESENDPDDLLARARAMIGLLSAALCWVIFIWSRSLWGDYAGLLSLCIAAFSPSLLAHGGLATSDTAAALWFIAALLAWWRLYHQLSLIRLVTAGIAVGLLAVSKYSALLFGPIAVVLLIARMGNSEPIPSGWLKPRHSYIARKKFEALFGSSIAAALIAWATVWAFYDFRFDPSPDPTQRDYLNDWDQLFLRAEPPQRLLADGKPAAEKIANFEPGLVQSFGKFALNYRLLPEAYVHGLLVVDRYSRSRLGYFAGEYSNTGWLTFFPTAVLTKSSLIALLLGAWAILVLVRSKRLRHWAYKLLPLIVFGAIYGLTIITSNLSIGHRHALPFYPILFILIGSCALHLNRRWIKAVLGVAVLLHIATSLTIRPHYLAYFNPIAGGSEEGHKLFVDSSLDWGQDLPGLMQWFDENPEAQPRYLSYFGYGDPKHYGFDGVRIGDSYFDRHARTVPAEVKGGTFAIGATMLRRVYTPVRGPWTASFEATYAQLQHWIVEFANAKPGSHVLDFDGSIMNTFEVTERLWKFEALQFGRLCHLLEHREPDAMIGYSILIYHLSDQEVNVALNGSLDELNATIVKALSR